MITFRLGDSLPAEVWLRWKSEMERTEPPEERRRERLRAAGENYLDQGHGSCLLRDRETATVVENSLLFFDKERYRLAGWVVMPNHVHVLVEIWDGFPMDSVLHSWKSYTSHEIGKLRQCGGAIWQEDYFDRRVRDENHYHRALFYIENNPVKAGLCAEPKDWRFNSARLK